VDFNLANVFRAIASAVGSRVAVAHRDKELTYTDVDDRSDRLAAFISASGLGTHTERAGLEPWQSGQDHVGLLLYNSSEYLESMLASFKARVAPFNINYRYTVGELAQVLADAQARGLIFHSGFAGKVAATLGHLNRQVQVLIQVPDDTDGPLLSGAIWYNDALAKVSTAALADIELSSDDLNIIYTGGTTGAPKGVLWRQSDAFVTSLAGRRKDHTEFQNLEEVVGRAVEGSRPIMPTSPFMHGGGQIPAFQKWHRGGTVVIQSNTVTLDAGDIWSVAARHRVGELMIVGDAFAIPLIDKLRRSAGEYDLGALRVVFSGGAGLSDHSKGELLQLLPGVRVIDAIGSTESGPMGTSLADQQGVPGNASRKAFRPGENTVLLDEDRRYVLPPTSRAIGWLARTGRVALGYLGDPLKTAASYPSVGGMRYLVLGDRARYAEDGLIEFLGRDESVINTGGEKVFSQEVEMVLTAHQDVEAAVVLGRPHHRWGNEVCAIIQSKPGSTTTDEALEAHCRVSLSGYKVPRCFIRVPELARTSVGKVDLAWAKDMLGQESRCSET
jgi:acyl-CoA synthetase (AMP-forming)/AMP-acid ligase II